MYRNFTRSSFYYFMSFTILTANLIKKYKLSKNTCFVIFRKDIMGERVVCSHLCRQQNVINRVLSGAGRDKCTFLRVHSGKEFDCLKSTLLLVKY